MAPKSAQEMQDEAGRQEQVDALQRGRTPEAFELRADFNADRFTLDNIRGVSNDVRDAIATVLGENDRTNFASLKTAYVRRVTAEGGVGVTEARRTEIGQDIAHERLDDAVMDVRVLEAMLRSEPELMTTLNQALKEDISLPLDVAKRPDVAIFLRTLFFSAEPTAAQTAAAAASTPPGDPYQAARLQMVRDVASLPNTREIRANQSQTELLNTRKKEYKRWQEAFETAKFDASYQEIVKAQTDLEEFYTAMAGYGGGRSATDIKSDIASSEADIDAIKANLGQKNISQPDRDRLRSELGDAKGDLEIFRDELENAKKLDERPKKERAHRELLLGIVEKLVAVQFANGDLFRSLGAPTTPLNTMLTTLRDNRNRYPNDKTNTPPSVVANEIRGYANILNTWIQDSHTYEGRNASRLEHIQAAIDGNIAATDEQLDTLKTDLEGLKKKQGKETSFNDRDFNVGLHVMLARNNTELSQLSRDDLEAAIKMNLVNDVLDMQENGRVGISFDRRRSSILQDINPTNRARFTALKNLTYYDKAGVEQSPLSAYNLTTTDAGNLYAAIANNTLTFPSAIFLYAALKISNLATHPNAQLLRRRIVDMLIQKDGDEKKATANFKTYIAQAEQGLRSAEQKNIRNPRIAGLAKNRGKAAERAARRARIKAGKLGLVEDLEKQSTDNGGVGTWDVTKTLATHGILRMAPPVLGFGRDAAKFVGKNTLGLAWGTTKIAGGIVTTVPGLALRTIGENLPDLIRPWRILGRAVKTSVNGVLHPVQSLRALSGRTGADQKLLDAKFYKPEAGKDLKESAAEVATNKEEAAKRFKKLHASFHYVMPNQYDWMKFSWDDTVSKSNVVELKPAVEDKKEEPKKDEKKSENGNGKAGADGATETKAAA